MTQEDVDRIENEKLLKSFREQSAKQEVKPVALEEVLPDEAGQPENGEPEKGADPEGSVDQGS